MGWTIIGMGFIAWLALVLLFTPRIDYHVTTPIRPDGDDFLHVIQATCQAAIHFSNKVEVFTNGTQFYPVMKQVSWNEGTCPFLHSRLTIHDSRFTIVGYCCCRRPRPLGPALCSA